MCLYIEMNKISIEPDSGMNLDPWTMVNCIVKQGHLGLTEMRDENS